MITLDRESRSLPAAVGRLARLVRYFLVQMGRGVAYGVHVSPMAIVPFHFLGMGLNITALIVTIRDLYLRPLTNPNTKLTWLLLILLTGGIGWLVYLFKYTFKPRTYENVLSVPFLAIIITTVFPCGLWGIPGTPNTLANDFDGIPKPLPQLPPGMVIEQSEPSNPARVRPRGGSSRHHTLLVARPRIAAGDLTAVPPSVFRYANFLQPALVASVVPRQNPNRDSPDNDNAANTSYEIRQVAVGFTILNENRRIVISSATQSELGLDLDFVRRQILTQSEKQLSGMTQVARNRECVLFDIPVVILRDGEHRPLILRHFVQVVPDEGSLHTLVWLLDDHLDLNERLVEGTLEWVPPDFREDRRLHVDRTRFFFGIPTPESFAMLDIPRGRKIVCPPILRPLASASRYSPQTLATLSDGIRQLLDERRD